MRRSPLQRHHRQPLELGDAAEQKRRERRQHVGVDELPAQQKQVGPQDYTRGLAFTDWATSQWLDKALRDPPFKLLQKMLQNQNLKTHAQLITYFGNFVFRHLGCMIFCTMFSVFKPSWTRQNKK